VARAAKRLRLVDAGVDAKIANGVAQGVNDSAGEGFQWRRGEQVPRPEAFDGVKLAPKPDCVCSGLVSDPGRVVRSSGERRPEAAAGTRGVMG
jgi:hypothetical protein